MERGGITYSLPLNLIISADSVLLLARNAAQTLVPGCSQYLICNYNNTYQNQEIEHFYLFCQKDFKCLDLSMHIYRCSYLCVFARLLSSRLAPEKCLLAQVKCVVKMFQMTVLRLLFQSYVCNKKAHEKNTLIINQILLIKKNICYLCFFLFYRIHQEVHHHSNEWLHNEQRFFQSQYLHDTTRKQTI